jgi:hypothetical protein
VQTPRTKTPHNQQHVKKDETCHRAARQQVQTPHTKPTHNQQHVKKDETCSLGMKKKM